MASVAGDEHAVGLVDPHLLDRRVVEERLQGTEAGDVGHDAADDAVGLVDGSDRAGQGPLLVGGDDVDRHLPDGVGLGARVDAPTPHLLTDLLRERELHRIHPDPPPRVLHRLVLTE